MAWTSVQKSPLSFCGPSTLLCLKGDPGEHHLLPPFPFPSAAVTETGADLACPSVSARRRASSGFLSPSHQHGQHKGAVLTWALCRPLSHWSLLSLNQYIGKIASCILLEHSQQQEIPPAAIISPQRLTNGRASLSPHAGASVHTDTMLSQRRWHF